MTRRERVTVGTVIEWAVAPLPPLPAVTETDAVFAFAHTLERGSRPERLALRGLLAVLEVLPLLAGERRLLSRLPRERRAGLLARLERGPAAPVGHALAVLAQLSYYGDLGVMRTLGYDPAGIQARGRALRAAESRW
jgi:hypothetical protein